MLYKSQSDVRIRVASGDRWTLEVFQNSYNLICSLQSLHSAAKSHSSQTGQASKSYVLMCPLYHLSVYYQPIIDEITLSNHFEPIVSSNLCVNHKDFGTSACRS